MRLLVLVPVRRVLPVLVLTVGLLGLLCDSAFAVESAPVISEQYVTGVAGTSATLNAQLDPEGLDTTYRFEYGPTSGYGSSTPVKGAGSGTGSVLVEAHVQELPMSTIYHYRLVASNSAGTVEGPDQTFTTQGGGGHLTLLDGRQWEVVSPQNKSGAGIEPQRYEGGLIQASEDGSAISYMVTNPLDSEPEGDRAPEPTQAFARRVPGGWSNRTINAPAEENYGLVLGGGNEYRLFSSDLSHSIIEHRGFMALAPGVTEPTPYLRNEAACEAKTTGCFTGLVTPEDTKPTAKWGQSVVMLSASSNLSHVALSSPYALTSDAPEGAPGQGLYEWSEGQLRFVGIRPAAEGGNAVNAELGFDDYNVRNAVSSDGSRIVWQESCGGGCLGPLYLRDTTREETVRLDAENTDDQFEDATSDGSHVFYLASPTGTNRRDLFSCQIVEIAGKLACSSSEVAQEVESVLGIAEEGMTVYFASGASLAAGAQPISCSWEGCNLYVAHFDGTEWTVHFIAALDISDHNSWQAGNEIVHLTSRVSPDGRFLAFMSDRSLTGYDNRDAVSGERDEEVFLYDNGAQKLACASCDPTGARPHGIYTRGFGEWPLIDKVGVWSERWIAGNVPVDNVTLVKTIHQPRYLSDDGRLFFNATDALVPQDTNGLSDVYEYEPNGAGTCAESEGCVELISSGASREESAFLEASSSGDDVFFMTSGRLTAQDEDSAYDVYDARVCSASAPCVQPAVTPPPCDSGDSCKGPPALQPSIFGDPASATFSGEGNVLPAKAVVRHRSAPTRAQRLARALRTCRRAHRHSRRKLRACERRARAKWGKAARAETAGRAAGVGMSGHNGRGR